MRIPDYLFALLLGPLSAAALPQGERPSPPAKPSDTRVAATPRSQVVGRIGGIVYDSLFGAPVSQAWVQLIAADSGESFSRTVATDERGEYLIRDIPRGRYTIGFFHPKLDSLGLAPAALPLSVTDATALRRDLAIPSAPRIREALCGPVSANRAGGILMGIVRDASTGTPISGATVSGEWTEFVIGKNQVERRTPRTSVVTGENGWFAICHVPSPGTVVLLASRGRDSTDFVETQLVEDGFRRHELFLGSSQITAEAASVSSVFLDDSLALPPRVTHVGEGRLRGIVRRGNSGRPLAGAMVELVNGPQTRTNELGEWEITNAPTGTRRVEVRAVGFYPERQTINVIDGAAPLDVSLATLRSVLDTVKISARYQRYSVRQEFTQRAKSGVGRYLTAEYIAKRNPLFVTDLFLNIPGLWVDGVGGTGDTGIQMRGLFSERCSPTIVINGFPIPGLFAADINGALYPSDVIGIEIYRAGTVPPQVLIDNMNCGAIVIWTK